MKKFLQILFHPFLLALIGVLALSALIWWVGPLIAIGEKRPLDPLWVRVLIVGLLFAILLVRTAFGIWNRKRTNAALVDGMAKGPSSADRELGVLNERFSQAIEVLKTAPSGAGRSVFGRSQFLYELPWYIFIGAPGSGKTTALLNAGLTFPLAEKLGNASVRGVGGTRNCDWWFTDEAVLIDTAGRYTTQESRQPGRRGGLGRLPRAAAQVAAAPPDQRRAGDDQRPGPAAADAGRAQGSRRQAARAHPGARREARRALRRSTCWSPRPT